MYFPKLTNKERTLVVKEADDRMNAGASWMSMVHLIGEGDSITLSSALPEDADLSNYAKDYYCLGEISLW